MTRIFLMKKDFLKTYNLIVIFQKSSSIRPNLRHPRSKNLSKKIYQKNLFNNHNLPLLNFVFCANNEHIRALW